MNVSCLDSPLGEGLLLKVDNSNLSLEKKSAEAVWHLSIGFPGIHPLKSFWCFFPDDINNNNYIMVEIHFKRFNHVFKRGFRAFRHKFKDVGLILCILSHLQWKLAQPRWFCQ